MRVSGLIVTFTILNSSPTIVCIRVQWNHPDLSGCAPSGVLAGRLLGNRGSLPLHKVKRGATLLFCRFELGTKLGTV